MKSHPLSPDGRDSLWAAVEPRLRRINKAFCDDAMSYEQYCLEIEDIRNVLGI